MKFNHWLLASFCWDGKDWSYSDYCQSVVENVCWKQVIEQRFPQLKKHEWYFEREELFERSIREGLSWTTPGRSDYPISLHVLESPPLLLSYLGRASWSENSDLLLSVVGSRQPDQLSLSWMEDHLSETLSLKNLIPVSGGARGIDQMAHSLAIRQRRPTVVWLPSGLFELYPRMLDKWKKEVIDCGGSFISCFPPYQPMYKWQFHIRNELIAGMSKCLLVVEARRRSGSMVTAAFARDQGRSVLVVPCSPQTRTGLGGLDLIVDGATIIRDSKDMIVAISR